MSGGGSHPPSSSGSGTILGTPNYIFWPAVGILCAVVIYVLWYFYGGKSPSSDDADLKPRTSNESNYTKPKEVESLEVGKSYYVDLKPGASFTFPVVDEDKKLNVYPASEDYTFYNTCSGESILVKSDGSVIGKQTKKCRVNKIVSESTKETRVEYDISY